MGSKSLMGILVFAAMALAAVYAYNYFSSTSIAELGRKKAA